MNKCANLSRVQVGEHEMIEVNALLDNPSMSDDITCTD